MNKNHIAVRLYLCFAMAITMVSAQVQGIEGDTMRITCNVAGTLPRWNKDSSITFTNEGNSIINPIYSTRFSYAADQKTLIVSPVQPSDAGTYVCLIGGVLGTDVVVSVLKHSETNNSENVQIANRALFASAIVVVSAVIIMCDYILKEGGENKNENEKEKKKDKQNENTKEIKVILIIAAVLLFITVSVFFIVMQTTAEDFEKFTEKEYNANIALLVVESVVFVLGVIAIIFLIRKNWWP